MILSQLRNYIREHKRVALRDLVYHFGVDAEAARGMLETLERKGRIRKLPSGTACSGGCDRCAPATIELYEAVDPGTPSKPS